MEDRDYQTACIDGIARGFHAGFMKQLVVMGTGGGKTIVFSRVAERFHLKRRERTLILAHREELTSQAAKKLLRATGIVASIEKAELHADRSSPVVVASIQTMQGDRLASWPKDHFGLIVIDEAHHALADSYQNILSHFNTRELGVTATPGRGDKKNLATHFQNLAYEIGMLDLIGKAFLVPVMVKSVPLRIDLNAVKQVGGDFDENQLDAAITPYLKELARYLATECKDRKKIVVFLPLIQTSQRFVEECLAVGIDARHVDGKSKDRGEILAGFACGTFRLLSNAMLLTEGWDEPGVDCVVPMRPTKSRELYAQIVGRGTRILDGVIDGLETAEERSAAILASDKKNLLLLDPLWLHERHDLAKPASLVARTKEEEKAITEAIMSAEEKDLAEAVEDAENEREAALIREIAENASKRERFMSIEHVGALLKDKKIQDYSPVFGWEKSPVTQAQKTVLDRFGLKCTTKGEASMVMNRLFARSKSKLATVKQLMWLVRMKHPSPETCTCKEAKAFLDEKWKKTA